MLSLLCYRPGPMSQAKGIARVIRRIGSTMTSKKTTKKAAAKTTSGSSKSTAKKKSVAKKTTAKRAPAKTAAKKSTAKKAPTKKPTAKKTVAKKATAKKTVAKKAPTKKTTAKKTAAKKPAAKKTAAKTSAKKTAAKTSAKKATASKAATSGATGKKATAAAEAKATATTTANTAPVEQVAKKPLRPLITKPPVQPKPPPRPVKLDKQTLAKARALLEQEKKELENRLSDLEAESVLSHGDAAEAGLNEEFADAGTATFDRERDLSIRNNVLDLIDQVTRALARVDEGTYGNCENCGRPIDTARLKAFPRALLCLDCKRREERTR